jgi:hypothetical protein
MRSADKPRLPFKLLIALFIFLFAVPLVFSCMQDEPVDIEVVLDAAIAQAVTDYRPQDVDVYDPAYRYLHEKYLTLLHQFQDSVAIMDSVRLELARCQVRQ